MLYLLCCLCFFSVSLSSAIADTNEKLIERLKIEGSQGWSVLEKNFEKIHCVWVDENDQDKNKKEIFRNEIFTDSGWFLLKKMRISGSGVVDSNLYENVICLNDEYSFGLLKSQQDKNWRINFCEPLMESTVIHNEEEVTVSVVKSSYAIFGKSLKQLLQEKEFVIESINEENIDGDDVIRVDFLLQPKNSLIGIFKDIKKGQIHLMPNSHWAIKKVFLELERDGVKFQNSITVSYTNNGGNCPQIKQVVFSLIRPPAQTIVWTSNFEKNERSDIDKGEFTLSHYGLPEPDFGEGSVGWFRYTLMAVGGLLIVYALWRMYRERKGTNV